MKNAQTSNDGRASATHCISPSNAEKVIQLTGDLPAMPHIAAQIMQKLAGSEASPREIHELIVKDPGLAARILKAANSPFYGVSRSVSSIKEATLLMGFDSISSLVMTAVMKDVFSKVSNEGQRLWEHSICCAVASKHIGGALRVRNVEEAFLAGLIHDIGKSVLFQQVPGTMRDIISMANERKNFWDAERELFGFTHAEVGRLLAQKWAFSRNMEEIVANHHEPDCALSARELTHVVSLADSLCHQLGIGLIKTPEIDPYELESAKVLGLGTTVIADALELLTETISSEENCRQ